LTHSIEEEKIPDAVRMSIRLMYMTSAGRAAVEKVKNILRHLTVKQGSRYDSPSSAKDIQEFVKFHHLNVEEIAEPLAEFKTFNEFFFRKLKIGARPVANQDPRVAVSPADCRFHVFPTIDEATLLWIKGKNFSLKNLLRDEALAHEFNGGSLCIARLAPQDYHRFHTPVDGVIGQMNEFPHGAYFTVNPMAIRHTVDVYTENVRVVTTIESPSFGRVVFVAVGATLVGSIRFTVKTGDKVRRGDELGYFAFGGSTCLVIFKTGAIIFDEDLLLNSTKPIETLVKVGMSIGKATHL